MPTPTREFSLDRYEQHTKVCPDSLQVVKNCEKIQSVAKICTVLVLAAKAIVSTYSEPSKWIARIDAVLAPKVIAQFLGLAATASFLANKIRCAFYYNYPARRRDADLEKIPSLWSDTNQFIHFECDRHWCICVIFQCSLMVDNNKCVLCPSPTHGLLTVACFMRAIQIRRARYLEFYLDHCKRNQIETSKTCLSI